MLRRALSTTSVFTWLMLSGLSSGLSDMAQIRDLEKVGTQFICCMQGFLEDAVLGPDIRVEAVVSGKSASHVLGLVGDYGIRLVDFCLSSGLLVRSSKNWPFYIHGRMHSALDRMRHVVRSCDTTHFNRDVSIFS